MNFGFRAIATSLLTFGAFTGYLIGQSFEETGVKRERKCGQPKDVRGPLIDEASRDVFTVNRVSFSGNVQTRDRDLRVAIGSISEGNIFTRVELNKGVKGLSKVRAIFPLTMDDIEIKLDRPKKDVEIMFCVRERLKL